MSAKIEMVDELFPNDPSTSGRELDAQDLRKIARAVLGRALYDIVGTRDYKKHRPYAVPGSNSTTAMRIGEEVREWFRDDSLYLFSFRMSCELAGYDYRKIRKGIQKYMTPKYQALAGGIDRCKPDVIEYIKTNGGVSHDLLRRAFRKRQHPTVLRMCLRELRDKGIITAKTRKEKFKNGKTKAYIQRWYYNG